MKVVGGLNVANIIDVLCGKGVIASQDVVNALQSQSNPQQQCRDLLMLLHASQHPQAFVQLYRAVRKEPQLRWLVECVDESSDQLVTDTLLQQNLSELTGKDDTQRFVTNILLRRHSIWRCDNVVCAQTTHVELSPPKLSCGVEFRA